MAVATALTIIPDPLTRLPASPTSSTAQATSAAPHTTADATAGPGQYTPTSAHVTGASPSRQNQDSSALPAASSSNSARVAVRPSSPQWTAGMKKRKPKAKTLFEVTVAIFAIFGVVWATFVSLPSWKLQKWSAGNDFLQACLALENPAVRSVRCNETIKLGPVAPPRWKRDLLEVPAATVGWGPFKLAATVVITLGVLVMATIYFRPRVEPFHPVVSMAREALCGPTHDWQERSQLPEAGLGPRNSEQPPYSENDHGMLGPVDEHWDCAVSTSDKADDLPHKCVDKNRGPDIQRRESTSGQRIGVWYESDSEYHSDDALSGDSGISDFPPSLISVSSAAREGGSRAPPPTRQTNSHEGAIDPSKDHEIERPNIVRRFAKSMRGAWRRYSRKGRGRDLPKGWQAKKRYGAVPGQISKESPFRENHFADSDIAESSDDDVDAAEDESPSAA